ncbi:MAG: outer membrane beta-barrel protein [Cyanothece sp. SIO1E1]|nr:outer membrane beta-barrel protein [Cyanothece sp. SIO1E1]
MTKLVALLCIALLPLSILLSQNSSPSKGLEGDPYPHPNISLELGTFLGEANGRSNYYYGTEIKYIDAFRNRIIWGVGLSFILFPKWPEPGIRPNICALYPDLCPECPNGLSCPSLFDKRNWVITPKILLGYQLGRLNPYADFGFGLRFEPKYSFQTKQEQQFQSSSNQRQITTIGIGLNYTLSRNVTIGAEYQAFAGNTNDIKFKEASGQNNVGITVDGGRFTNNSFAVTIGFNLN